MTEGSLPVRSILFDLDGTLIDSRADLAASVNVARAEFNLPPLETGEIVRAIGDGMAVLLERTIPASTEADKARARDVFVAHYQAHCTDLTRLYPGVAEALGVLNDRVKLAVVTNKPEGFTRRILRHFSIESFFGSVVGGETVSPRKPAPDPLWRAIADLSGTPRETLIVGDGFQDMQAGRAAGTLRCGARYGFGWTPAAEATRPDFMIDRFDDLLAYFMEERE